MSNRTLKKVAGVVLASLKSSTYVQKYASDFPLLRPGRPAFLNVLRVNAFMTHSVKDYV